MAVNHFAMQSARALVATNPLRFGRAPVWQSPAKQDRRRPLSGDAQLFAATFAAGFLFVSILIA